MVRSVYLCNGPGYSRNREVEQCNYRSFILESQHYPRLINKKNELEPVFNNHDIYTWLEDGFLSYLPELLLKFRNCFPRIYSNFFY